MEGRRVGRYLIGQELASGGMATVHLGRMQGPAGFGKTVAIKRLHAQFAKDAEFSSMFLDEARVTSGLMHPNIVMTLDVMDEPDGLYLVMEYVHGVSLAMIQRHVERERAFPHRIVSAIVSGFLEGLHAAHEATDDSGEPLGIVHRDVSPQNVLVSFAGITKIADFGIAKAAGRMHSTGDGSAKGKLSYMAPEQVNMMPVTPRTDVFAAGIVLWECLTREKLIGGTSAAERLRSLIDLDPAPPSSISPGIPPALDAVVMRALSREPEKRFATAKEMASELQRAVGPASSIEVAEWVKEAVPDLVREREAELALMHRMSSPSTSGAFLPVGSPQQIPGAPSSNRAPSSSNGETSAGNHTIADYFSRSEKDALPPRMPRVVVAALIALPTLAIIGIVLVLITMMRAKREASAAAGSVSPPSSVAAHLDPSATPTPTNAAISPPSTAAAIDDATTAGATASSTVAAAASQTKPKQTPPPTSVPAAPAAATGTAKGTTAGKKCRIVATPDKSGRMKFEEVCTP